MALTSRNDVVRIFEMENPNPFMKASLGAII
ncbi:hypothetical protein OKW21_001749 [Catalinimonas alkaloidigena]|nr:hypothetical protein [Catalinimonas alkaloidigena]